MKKIAILTMGVKLKGEKGYTRFGYLAEFLVKAGYQVDLITTTFQPFFFRTEKRKNSPVLKAMKASAISDRKSMPSMTFTGTMSRQ